MLLLVDNYDSFTYNLAQYAGELGYPPLVVRNDAITVADALALRPGAIIISPGPGAPAGAGICVELIRAAAGQIPILGVCLGHQAIGAAFGARIVAADRLMHGKPGLIAHSGAGIFSGIASPFAAMRYHSLLVSAEALPAELEVVAWSADRAAGAEIMGLRHRSMPVHGVQFHPESIGTEQGRHLLRAFLVTSLREAA